MELLMNVFLFKELSNNFVTFCLYQVIQLNLNNVKYVLNTTTLHSWTCIHQKSNFKGKKNS